MTDSGTKRDFLLPTRKHLRRVPVWIPDDRAVIYFVTVCCQGRRNVFTGHEPVRLALESLKRASEKLAWRVAQVCFMPDHVHLMLMPNNERDQPLAKLMQRWKSSAKQRLNRAGMEGDIWQPEFFDHLLRSGECLTDKWRYVEMNPVRAGLSERPEAYPYLGAPEEVLKRIS